MFKRLVSYLMMIVVVITMPITAYAQEEEILLENDIPTVYVPATRYPLKYVYLEEFNEGIVPPISFDNFGIGNPEESTIAVLERTYEIDKKYNFSKGLNFTIIHEGNTASGVRAFVEGASVRGTKTEALAVDSSTGATYKFRQYFEVSGIDSDLSELRIEVNCSPVQIDNSNLIKRYIIVKNNDGRGEAPQNLSFKISEDDSGKYVLENADETMEYRLKSGKEWTSCTSETTFDVPTTATSYYVRYKATEDTKESQVTELLLRKVPAAPKVTIGSTSEQFTGLTTDMEIAVNDGEFIPVTEEIIEKGATPYIDALNGESGTLKIRKAQTEETAASKVTEITIYPRREMTMNPVYNENTYIMTGVSSSIQYKVEGQSWKTVSDGGKQLNFLNYAKEDGDTYVDIKMKAIDGYSSSKTIRYTIKQLAEVPEYLTLNYKEVKLDGFRADREYQYKKPGSTSWTTAKIENGSLDISSCISAEKDVTVQIREKGTDTSNYSAILKVLCKQRPAKPSGFNITYATTDSVDTAMLSNVNRTMEYKIGSDGEIKAFTGNSEILDIPTSGKTVYVRYAGTETEFPSLFGSVTLKAKRSAPSITYNSTKEILSGLKDTMEYSIDGREYTQVEGITTLDCKEIIDRIPKGESKQINIRLAETEEQPVGKDKVITLYGRADEPTGLTFDKSTNKLKGIKSTMQYREKGTESWKSISSGSTVTLTKLINGRDNVQLEVRYKATSKAAASDVVIINLY